MLAIAKMSAARNRHPEIMVSLSILSGGEAMNNVWRIIRGPCPNVTPAAEGHGVGCYQPNLAPFNGSLLLWFCCAFCSNVCPFESSKSEPAATKGSKTTRKSITSQMPVVVQSGKTIARSAPRPRTAFVDARMCFSSSSRRNSSIGYSCG